MQEYAMYLGIWDVLQPFAAVRVRWMQFLMLCYLYLAGREAVLLLKGRM
jgi:hypothetical protein